MVTVPPDVPKQFTEEPVPVRVIPDGSVIVPEYVPVQPFESVIKTEYVPANLPAISSVVAPPGDQR